MQKWLLLAVFQKQQQKQLDNLKKQAEEATRYKEISKEIKKIEAGLYYLKVQEIEKDKNQIDFYKNDHNILANT